MGRVNNFLRALIYWFIFALFLLFVGPIHSEEDTDRVRLEIWAKADRILIKNKLCSDSNDCRKKRLIFYGRKKNSAHPRLWGVHVESFEIEDADVVSELVELVISEYYLNNRRVDIDFDFYRKPHREMMGVKKLYIDPFLRIELKGVKK